MKYSIKNFNNYDNLICIEIDDYPYFFDSEITIFQACLEKNIIVPRFCYHSKLSIAGNCRMCSIEEKKSEKVILSCSTLIDKETEIFTSTFLVLQARENVIEYLLSNHPLDCPICDQGGECDLQDQAMLFGGDIGRFYENFKRAVENKNFSPLIKFSLNRCIHCARCTRYFSEVSGSFLFSLLGRGLETEISFYNFSLFSDETSGNVIDLCPVGALTSKPYSFIGRIWEYLDITYVDIFDDFLSNIRVDVRGTSIIRVLPQANYLINDEWISDKVRFNYDSYLKQRLVTPFFIFLNKYYFFSWLNSLFFIKKYLFLLVNFYLIKKKKNYFFNFGFDRFNDTLSSFFIKSFSQFYGLNYFYFNCNSNSKVSDFRGNFVSNIKLNELDLADEEDESYSEANYNDLFNEKTADASKDHDGNSMFLLIFMNLNLRYESPIYNIKIKKILKNNTNFLVFNFGFYNYFNYHSLGFNYLSFFKNFISSIIYFFISNLNIIFFLGTSFFYNSNKIFNILLLFKFFFYQLFNFSVYFNYITCLSNRVMTYELNILNKLNFLRFNYSTTPLLFYNIDLNNIDLNLNLNKNNLFIYQGHHGGGFIKYSNLVLPSTIFLERPDLFINTEGYFSLFYYNYFKYFLDSAKDSWSALLVFFKLLNNFFNYSFNNLNIFLNKISPIFYNKNNNLYIFVKYSALFSYFNNYFFVELSGIFFSFINNFYLDDTISKHSLVMSLCSKKYTIINDFKNFFNNLFF